MAENRRRSSQISPVSWSISYLLRLPRGISTTIGHVRGQHRACRQDARWSIDHRASRTQSWAAKSVPVASEAMEFRRITNLPPYVFTIIDGLKVEARRAGVDVIDLGFGNPDLPSPDIAVEKLCRGRPQRPQPPVLGEPRHPEAARGRRRPLPAPLRRRPSTRTLEVISTIGAKEGFSHLMWVLLSPGDAALVPSPSYPIHIWGPLFAGADVREIPMAAATRTSSRTSRRPTSTRGPSPG